MKAAHRCSGKGFHFEGSVIVRWKVLLSPKCRKKTFKCHRKQVRRAVFIFILFYFVLLKWSKLLLHRSCKHLLVFRYWNQSVRAWFKNQPSASIWQLSAADVGCARSSGAHCLFGQYVCFIFGLIYVKCKPLQSYKDWWNAFLQMIFSFCFY